MPTPVFKRYEQILQAMINTVVARSPLTDITDSSSFKHPLAAMSRELDEAYYQMGLLEDIFSLDTAVGPDLDARAREVQPTALYRAVATKSSGQVTFSRAGTSGTVTVPSGTVVKTPGGVAFSTTAIATIANGFSSSGPVAAVARDAGAAGNVASNTVTRFESKPVGVDSVTNAATFNGGLDTESDDAFRARIRAYIRSLPRSTEQALEYAAAQVVLGTGQRVRFAHVYVDPYYRGEVTLYVDDGSGTAAAYAPAVVGENLCQGLAGPGGNTAVGGEVFLYADLKPLTLAPPTLSSSTRGALTLGTHYLVDDTSARFYFTPALVAGEVITASYTAWSGLVAEVQKVVDGDPANRQAYPGWRAAGVRVRVTVPTVLQQTVQAAVVVAEGYTKGALESPGVYTAGSVLANVQASVANYINNLGISGDVVRAELITAVMEVPGVINVLLALPTTDAILLDDQLPRITASSILLT